MALSPSNQRRALQDFLKSGLNEIDDAARVVTRRAALQLRAGVQREMRRNFKGSGQFTKGIKIYNLDKKGNLGPAAYVRLGRIQSQFQEPTTLVGRRSLVILLDSGRALGFERIGKRNTWESFIRTWGNRLIFKPLSGGATLVLFKSNTGVTPIYKLQKQVRTSKRLTFLEQAEQIGDKLADSMAEVIRDAQ